MKIKPIRRVSISDQVFEQMKSLILSGEWAQSIRLPSETALADMFGVSRVTIRQCIHRIVALGLAETRAGDGTYIRSLTPEQSISNLVPIAYLNGADMLSVLEFRKAIEGYTAELAAKKANGGDIARLEMILEEMEREKGNAEAFSEADYAFHHELAVISRNPLILGSYNLIGDILRSALKTIVEKCGHSQGLYYHKAILDRIRAKDKEGCRRLMTEHIEDTYGDMVSSEVPQ
jgi:GntR family transcriptional repressor for pyruvate dehydrogenase complex